MTSPYDQAIELCQKEQSKLGLANAYKSLGDLLLSAKRTEEALPLYQDAISLYQSEQEPMGLAYTLSELIRCNHQLGALGSDEVRKLAVEALNQAERSGVESVTHYVLGALHEFFDKDEKKLKDFLKSISVDD